MGTDRVDYVATLPRYIDTNVYCGPYPFRPLPAADAPGLKRLLDELRIDMALVTPFPSIFHNRPWSGLEPWIETADERVRFWAVINPSLPGWENDLDKAIQFKSIIGIRLFPRCHGYNLQEPGLIELLTAAERVSLPTCLTARLLDDRLYPRMMRVDPPLDLQEVGALLKRFPRIPWVLNSFAMPEIRTLRSTILSTPVALVDIGISKPFEPWWENLIGILPVERMLLGTGAPLYYHAGTRLSLVRSGIDPAQMQKLLTKNAQTLLRTPDSDRRMVINDNS